MAGATLSAPHPTSSSLSPSPSLLPPPGSSRRQLQKTVALPAALPTPPDPPRPTRKPPRPARRTCNADLPCRCSGPWRNSVRPGTTAVIEGVLRPRHSPRASWPPWTKLSTRVRRQRTYVTTTSACFARHSPCSRPWLVLWRPAQRTSSPAPFHSKGQIQLSPWWYNAGKGGGFGLVLDYMLLGVSLKQTRSCTIQDLDELTRLIRSFEDVDRVSFEEAKRTGRKRTTLPPYSVEAKKLIVGRIERLTACFGADGTQTLSYLHLPPPPPPPTIRPAVDRLYRPSEGTDEIAATATASRRTGSCACLTSLSEFPASSTRNINSKGR